MKSELGREISITEVSSEDKFLKNKDEQMKRVKDDFSKSKKESGITKEEFMKMKEELITMRLLKLSSINQCLQAKKNEKNKND